MAFKAGAIVGEASLDTSGWNSGLKKMSKGVGVAVGAISTAFVAGMTASIAKADEFQKSMSNVSTVVDTSVVSTQDLTKELLKLDPALGNTTELTDGLYQSFSAGAQDAEEALKITSDSAKFARAALTDTATSVDVLTTAVNAYGRENIDTTKASDIFFTTIKQGKITGDQLATTIGQSIPLFASTGIELEQLASGMAAMTKQGISANESTTQLNAIVNSFLKPSEEMQQALQGIGFESGSAFIEAEGLTGALSFLENQTGGNAAEIAKLLPNVRAMRGAMALTGVGGEEFTKILGEMESSVGATDEAFDKQEKTFDTLKNSLDNLQIVTGNIGKHFVDEIAGGATEATTAMIGFLTSSQGADVISNIIGFLSGSFEALKTAIMPIIDVIGPGLERIFEESGEALKSLTGEASEGAAASQLLGIASNSISKGFTIASKIVASAIQGIGDLVAAASQASKIFTVFFDVIKGEAKFSDVKDQFKQAVDAFENFGSNYVTNLDDIISTTVDAFTNFGDDAETLATDIEVAYTTSFTNTKNSVQANWDEMITGQKDFVDQLVSNIEGANVEISNSSGDASTNVEQTWLSAIAGIAEGFGELLPMAVEAFDMIVGIGEAFAETELNNLEAKHIKEQESLQNKLDNNLITQEQFDKQKEEMEKRQLAKKNELEKKVFEGKKATDIANVWIDAAGSIAGWWAVAPQLGPIAGPIFAGVMTKLSLGMAAAQTAAINSRNFVPAFQMGGTTEVAGPTRINEQGGEIVNLPDGTVIVPNDISRQIANDVGQNREIPSMNIILNNAMFKDKKMIEEMAKEISTIYAKNIRYGVV